MKQFVILCLLILLSVNSVTVYAQKKEDAKKKVETEEPALATKLENYDVLRQHEDSLQQMLKKMVEMTVFEEKKAYCYKFIPKLISALKVKGSFEYPFDSLKIISMLTPTDKKFRIFTWMLEEVDTVGNSLITNYRYYGAIQMNNEEEFELYGLVDKSTETSSPEAQELSPKDWFGALYYNIIQKRTPKGQTYYTLFGWDGNNERSTKKIAEVLYFNKEDKPIFGAPIFEIVRDGKQFVGNRYIMEFKEGSNVGLNYHTDKNIIIYDFLKPEKKETEGEFSTYVPDGTYHGFEFKGGMWKYVPKIFTTTLPTAPRPKPVLDSGSKRKKKKRRKRKKK